MEIYFTAIAVCIHERVRIKEDELVNEKVVSVQRKRARPRLYDYVRKCLVYCRLLLSGSRK